MKSMRIAQLSVLVLLLAAPALRAQATRTWVSGVGDDLNPCSRTAPCKTFAGAINKTAAGGEISVLDPGGYGAVTITKAITINGEGTLASILSVGTNGVIINAGANDRVVLRNISINGGGSGLNGIRFLAGRSLLVEDVAISGFTGRGIDMTMTTNGRLVLKDSSITSGATGVFVTTANGFLANASLDNVHLTLLNNGVEGSANSRITVSNSMITGNASSGVLASSSTSRVNVEGCQIAFNDVAGVNASVSGAIVRISDNEIYNNNEGINIAAGASVESAVNNRDQGNVSTTNPNGAVTIE